VVPGAAIRTVSGEAEHCLRQIRCARVGDDQGWSNSRRGHHSSAERAAARNVPRSSSSSA
jgi:hypothetical protein